MDLNEDILYLQNVDKQLVEFCSSHKKFERAIQNILIRNFRLENENNELRSQLKDCLNSAISGGKDV